MNSKRTETELHQFYEQWAPFVTAFCKLYIGDLQVAESAVTDVFLKYFRSELPLGRDHVPVTLMSLALETSNCAGESEETDANSAFEWAVLGLPPEERAVFILHGVLDLQLPWVAAITQNSFANVSQLWIRALIQLRMSIVRDGCSRLFAECRSASQADPGACA